jgi:hypothetical protein
MTEGKDTPIQLFSYYSYLIISMIYMVITTEYYLGNCQ